ncbi:hypothetical protein F4803DRAFT_552751 [Xylaria telfairii]|nr:hypothetical protein F4803DRAFT_552751 [Xylaria telfairii]
MDVYNINLERLRQRSSPFAYFFIFTRNLVSRSKLSIADFYVAYFCNKWLITNAEFWTTTTTIIIIIIILLLLLFSGESAQLSETGKRITNMCCKKNRITADAYGHRAGPLPYSYAQQGTYEPTLHEPHTTTSRGPCCGRRRRHKRRGGLLTFLIGEIREHQARVGTETRDKPLVYQDRRELKEEEHIPIGNKGGHEYPRIARRDGENAREEASPPSYETVMKSG